LHEAQNNEKFIDRRDCCTSKNKKRKKLKKYEKSGRIEWKKSEMTFAFYLPSVGDFFLLLSTTKKYKK
jgi:hypothetical protein